VFVKNLFAVIFSLLLFTNLSLAKLSVETLVSSDKSWDGNSFKYPKGSPKITIKKILVDADKGFKGFHCHIIPLAAYIVKGRLEVVKKSGQVKVFKEGDAFVEVMNVWHAGRFSKGSEIIVFYAGDTKLPFNIYPKDTLSHLCK